MQTLSTSSFFSSPSKSQPLIVRARSIAIMTLVIGTIHYGLATLAQSVSFESGASAIWPSSGFYLGAIMLFGPRLWLPILLSELFANALLFYPNAPATIIGISAISTVEPLVTAWLISRFIGKRDLFGRTFTWRGTEAYFSLTYPCSHGSETSTTLAMPAIGIFSNRSLSISDFVSSLITLFSGFATNCRPQS